jgi:hypothetical protein
MAGQFALMLRRRMCSRGFSGRPLGEPVDARSALREGIAVALTCALMIYFGGSAGMQVPAEALLLPTVGSGLLLGGITFGLAQTVRGTEKYLTAIFAASLVIGYLALHITSV